MSVRDKVKGFESLKNEPVRDQTTGKKFLFPGNKQLKKPNEPTVSGVPQTRSKPSILSEFEANLEEVWSVRKNIHHNNNVRTASNVTGLNTVVSSSLSVPKFNQSQSYSRHGALGTHQSEAPHGITLDNNVRNRRLPLHDNNTIETSSHPRNTRPTGFLLTETTQRHNLDTTQTNPFVPVTNRKRTFKGGGGDGPKFSSDHSSLFTPDGHVSTDHKVSYAKRMAEAHLRSAGLGEYTPKQSGYSKLEENDDRKSAKWRKIDDNDEFSF